MKSSEVHGFGDPQLVELVGNKRQELFNLRFQHATGQLEDTAGISRAKRDLARAMTIARERGIDVETELAKQRKRLGVLTKDQEAAIESLLMSTVNKISHPIISQMRRFYETGEPDSNDLPEE